MYLYRTLHVSNHAYVLSGGSSPLGSLSGGVGSSIASSSGTTSLNRDSTKDTGSRSLPLSSRALCTVIACRIAPITALEWACVILALFLATYTWV